MIFQMEQYGTNIALRDDSKVSVTYDELLDVSQFLQKKIGSRKLVLLLASNTIGCLVFYIALLHSNNVVQMVDEKETEERRQQLIHDFCPDYICCLEGYETGRVVEQQFSYQLCECNLRTRKSIYPELSLLLPTSGSTEQSKFVRLSRKNIETNMCSIISYLDITSQDRPILSLPVSYTYGLSVVHTHIAMGATLLITAHSVIKKEFWDFFCEEKATSFSGVPYTYELIDRFHLFQHKLPSLRCLTQAGGKLSEDLQKKIAAYSVEHQIRFFIMYGQTEATARMTYLPDKEKYRMGSVGIPVQGGKIRLLDEEESIIQSTQTEGEIVYLGDNVSLGYARNKHDLQKGDERQGVLKTGDIGYLDEDGFLYISGRKKRFAKLCGKRLSLDYAERIVQRGEPTFVCAIISDDRKLFVFTEINFNIEEKVKREQQIAAKLNLHWSQVQIVFIEKIPRNDSGKIKYGMLEEEMRGNRHE